MIENNNNVNVQRTIITTSALDDSFLKAIFMFLTLYLVKTLGS